MRKNQMQQIKVIQESDPISFQESFNKAMRELSDKKATVQWGNSDFMCYITYCEEVNVSEDLSDEYYLKTGHKLVCENCPYFELPTDKRKKYCKCQYSDFPVQASSSACELFYRRLMSGEIEVV